MQRPIELDRMITGLVGRWSVEARIQGPDGDAISGVGHFEAEKVSLGRGIHSTMSIDLKNLGPYEEDVVWGYDQLNNEVRNLSVISDGRIRDHTGKWIDDHTMELRWVGRQKEEGAIEAVTISMITPDEVRGHIIGKVGNCIMAVIDYVLRRA